MSAVSVIIPVYGVEAYIEKCARSLFEQTLEDIEYIFVDDCTKDKSIEILQKVIDEYPNRKHQIRIIHHETNRGLPQARKTGIENATSKYIAHCDSDDWVEKDMYRTLYHQAESDACDAVVCDLYKTQEQIFNYIHYFPQKQITKDSLLSNIFSNTCSHYFVTILYKKQLFDNPVKYPEANWFEDLVFTSQILYYAKKIGYVQKPLYHYIIRPTSMTNAQNLDKKRKALSQMRKNIDVILSFIEENNVGEKYETILKFFHILNYKDFVRTPQLEQEYKQYNYSSIKGSILFNKNFNIILKIRYLLLSLKLYGLYDWLVKMSENNSWFKNKISK